LPLPDNVHELPGVKNPEPVVTEKVTIPVGSVVPDVLVTVTVHVDSSLTQTGESQESEMLVVSAAYPKNPSEMQSTSPSIKDSFLDGRNR
jgi:phage gp29-like protein